jgi:hypothetical protein
MYILKARVKTKRKTKRNIPWPNDNRHTVLAIYKQEDYNNMKCFSYMKELETLHFPPSIKVILG